jgi:flagellum-specific ATP synthase
VWLSRRLAERGHYPAIDVLRSISRLANDLSATEERKARQIIRELLAAYAENEDLVTIGAYRKGANRTLDAAVEMRDAINAHLRQPVEQRVSLDDARRDLAALASVCQLRLTAAGVAPSTPALAPAATSGAVTASRSPSLPTQAKKKPTVIKRA